MEFPDEINLISQLSNDDPEAFEKLFRRYHIRIYAFAFRLLTTSIDAEEIVQDVFLALWSQRKSLQLKTSLSSYLFGIARNKVYEVIRQKLQNELIAAYILEQRPEYVLVTEEEILYNDLNERLNQLLTGIPQRRREIFLLNRKEGLSYQEISKKLGITENTVDTQIRHALNYLRNKLSGY